jgi:hypothetical protein
MTEWGLGWAALLPLLLGTLCSSLCTPAKGRAKANICCKNCLCSYLASESSQLLKVMSPCNFGAESCRSGCCKLAALLKTLEYSLYSLKKCNPKAELRKPGIRPQVVACRYCCCQLSQASSGELPVAINGTRAIETIRTESAILALVFMVAD